MMRCLRLLVALPMLLWTLGIANAGSEELELLTLSIPRLNLESGERVIAFEINLQAAAIHAMPDVPVGWTVSIDNDASWSTNVKATAQVGAAAVDPSFFQDFLLVQKNEFDDLKFNVTGEITVTRDYVNVRAITLTRRDFEARSQERRP